MIQVNFIKHIIDQLKARGFRHKRWRNGDLGTAVYIQGPHPKHAKVVVKSIEIPPRTIGSSVDEYFKKLQAILKGLTAAIGPIQLFLPGGGSIPIPEWFKNWCIDNEVEISICNPDRVPEIS